MYLFNYIYLFTVIYKYITAVKLLIAIQNKGFCLCVCVYCVYLLYI